MNIKTYN